MIKKSLFSFTLASLCSLSHASTCPDPNNIRLHTLFGWKAYTIDNGTPVTPETYERFARSVDRFALSEWIPDRTQDENLAHCYYQGKKSSDNYLGVYLAKQKIRPDKTSHLWKGWGTDYMYCEDNLYQCRFVEQ